MVETNSSGTLYMPDSTNTDDIIKTTDKGDNWSSLSVPGDDLVVVCLNYVSGEDRIYYSAAKDDYMYCAYIDTTNDNEQWVFKFQNLGNPDQYDVPTIVNANSDVFFMFSIDVDDGGANDGQTRLYFQQQPEDGDSVAQNMGAWAARTHDASFCIDDGDGNGWFLWQWSDEDVELWKFDVSGGTVTQAVLAGGGSFAGASLHSSKAMQGIAFDNVDSLFFVVVIGGVNKLHRYDITTDTLTNLGTYDVSLMLERNTASGVLEKAFHLTAYEVYQIQEHKQQLYLIATPDTGEVIIAITDNFLMTTTGKMFEYEDQIGLLSSVIIDHEVEEASRGIITLIKGSIPIEKNMSFRFFYNYTTATATAESIIFEGIVTNFTEDQMQTVTLVNLAKKEIKTILPVGDYTKDTDGLMSQLIIDYNNYVTEGTLSDGGDLGTISLGGVHSEETIFDGCAKFDGFLWYFNPTGQLFYNNGTVDSGVDYNQASVLSGVKISHVHEEYNKIKVRGAYVDGVQVESDWQEDLESQQRLGINERIFLISFLNTVALCNTAASNILTLLAKDPLKVKFTIKDATKGYIQVGETITFEYAASGKIVASDQFIITSATINKYGDIRYTITSELS